VAEADHFNTFIDSLLARIAAIIDIYGGGEFVLPCRLTLWRLTITAEQAFTKVVIAQGKQPIVGVKVTVTYSGNLTGFMPYIELGSQIHVGKLATRGCGQYRFETLK
jgi:hypothetical protein